MKLEKYCNTPRQRTIARMREEGAGWGTIAKHLGMDIANARRTWRFVKGRAEKDGVVFEEDPITVNVQEVITQEEEHRLKAQVASLRSDLKQATSDLAEANNIIRVMDSLSTPKVKPKKIKRGKSRHEVSATAFLSDTHFDEMVSLEQTNGVNEYTREIAERRLGMFAEKTLIVSKDLMSGFETVHLDLPFGGDMVSGNIHEELARTNEAEIMDTVDHWSEKLAEVVVTLSKEFPSVHIPCVVGNHGRNTRKPRHKGRVRDNFDWLIYRNVQRILAGQVSNVSMQVSESTDATWETMGHKYCLTHGDQASGGAGWGGIFSPIMRLYEKKLKSYSGRGESFDYLIMGHWHQFIDAGPIIVNGTTKGYDEFANNLNFRPEPPQQAFWLTDPEKGKIFSGPLFVGDE